MRASDLATGLFFALVGLGIVVLAQQFRMPAGAASPRLFPTIIGSVMIAFGLLVAGREVVRHGLASPVSAEGWMRDRRALLALAIPLAIAAFGLGAPRVGTIATSSAIVFAVALFWGARPLHALILAPLFSTALYVFFARILSVPLPRGAVEAMLP